MCIQPPSPYRAIDNRASFNLESYLRRVFDSVGYDIAEHCKVGEPGEYTGTARCGGLTYQFALNYFAREVMSKFDDQKQSSDEQKTKVALERFAQAEALCAETNVRFETYFYGHRPANEQVSRVIVRAREKIGRLLNKVDWDRVRSGFSFTSGGSVKLPRARGTPIHKYSSNVEATATNLSMVSDVFHPIHASDGFADQPEVLIVSGNKLTCVPKNYKTHRIIGSEPSGSMYLQKGLHKELRRLLRTVGIDLSSQQQNQEWARFGSATGLVATVDMSMASDTVAKTVVEWFLSLNPDVLQFLDKVRSTKGGFADDMVTYHKYSSMGNATTFEIETLIFWSLATSVCEVLRADSRFVAVYGDDVVLPNRCVPLFFEVLKECGFVPNESKTFYEVNSHSHADRFRESCGKHYYRGEDVSPVYIRKPVETLVDKFKLVNNLTRWLRILEKIGDAPSLEKAWALVADLRAEYAPSAWVKPRIPDGFGDGAFIGTFDECTPNVVKGKNNLYCEGYAVEVLVERFDQAVGISPAGRPLKWKHSKGKPSRMVEVVLKDGSSCKISNKQVRGVSLRGYALASLEQLERYGPSWPTYMQRLPPRLLAKVCAGVDFVTESSSIPLAATRQIVTSILRLKPGVTW